MRNTNNKNDFKKQLNEKGIHVTFHENDQKRIYGVTFTNNENRVVLNGSRLGKEFSANVFEDLFNNPNKRAEIIENLQKQVEKTEKTLLLQNSLSTETKRSQVITKKKGRGM